MAPRDNGTTRFLAVPGQLLVFILIVGPILGLVVGGIAPAPSGLAWRMRTVGMAVDTMVVPVFALFLGIFLAAHLEHRRLQWLHTVLAGLLGLVFLAALPLHALDALEIRARIDPDMKSTFDANTGRNLLLLLSYGSVLVLLFVMSLRQLRRSRAAASEPVAAPLVRPSPGGARPAARS